MRDGNNCNATGERRPMSVSFTDMMGRQLTLPAQPKRIVSLVPSQTELLYDLGLDDEVVGITKFCVHPKHWFRNKKRVGGTKTVHLDVVRALSPDLIIANKEENTQEQIEALAKEFPVWISDIQKVTQGLEMIERIGEIVCKVHDAKQLISNISAGFEGLQQSTQPFKVAYYIWKSPWMCAGGDTFISDMINSIGWQNVNVHLARYPEVSPDTLINSGVQLVLLSSEPYPFKEKHIDEIRAALPQAEVLLVDGEMFSWYGSRMAKAIPYLSELVNKFNK